MRVKTSLVVGGGLVGVLTAMIAIAGASSPHRLVVVVATPGDPRAVEQHAALVHDAAALRERDVVVQDMTPEVGRRALGVGRRATFEVLLVGKDGGVKLRRDRVVAPSEIAALIDTMPMRRDEMRRRGAQAGPRVGSGGLEPK
jgi:hypothetical protein